MRTGLSSAANISRVPCPVEQKTTSSKEGTLARLALPSDWSHLAGVG